MSSRKVVSIHLSLRDGAKTQKKHIKMKFIIKSAALAIMLFIGCNLSAQSNMTDVVYCKNGAVIRGTIIEQVPGVSVKIQTADGNVFVYQMEEVEKMTKETSMNQPTISTDGDDMCYKGMTDAGAFYRGKGSYRGGIWATTLLTSPLLGLIPTAIAASNSLDNSQMNYPSQELWKNSDYRNCYTQEATKKKNKRAWTAWGVSSAVWLGVIVVLNAVATGM